MLVPTAAILVFFYPIVCGAIAELFRMRPLVRTLVWIAAFLPLLALLVVAALDRDRHELDVVAIIAIVALGWGLLFWTGQKIGRPVGAMLAERRSAEKAFDLEEQFR